MSNVRLIVGLHFSLPPCFKESEAEELYRQSVFPLIELLLRFPKFKVTLYFSGNLMAWLKKRHPESLLQLRTCCSKHKQIEFLSNGYYEPPLQLISRRSCAYQIEKHFTAVRDSVGKGIRPKGFWLNDGNWETSFPSILSAMGFLYTFIDDSVIRACGFSPKDMFDVFVTEEQGHSLYLFPIIESLSSPFCKVPVDGYVDNLSRLSSTCHDDTVTVFKNGFSLNAADYEWMARFIGLCGDASLFFAHPGNVIKKAKDLKLVYIPDSVGDECAGRMFFDGQRRNYDLFSRQFDSTDCKTLFRRGAFRNFLIKYRESAHLYHRIRYIEAYLKTLPKVEQKQCADVLAEGQTAYPMRKADDAGVFDAAARQKSYTALISIEKVLKKNAAVREIDFDNDGLTEIFHYGPTLLALFHRKGASIRELDYLPSSFNYVNTFCDYDENCEFGRFLRRGAACFQDFFILSEDYGKVDRVLEPSAFQYDLSDFSYESESINEAKRVLRFALSLPDNIEMSKDYLLKRNDVTVEYRFDSTGNQNLSRYFGTELNLSFSDCSLCSAEVFESQDLHPLDQTHRFSRPKSLKLNDGANDTTLTLSFFGAPCDVFMMPIYAETDVFGERRSLYQHVSVKIVWELDLKAESSCFFGVALNIVRSVARG